MAAKKTRLQKAVSVVQEVKEVVAKFPVEYIHTQAEHVIDELDRRYPKGGKGSLKLGLARTLLARVFGTTYVNRDWSFFSDLIAGIVAIKKA